MTKGIVLVVDDEAAIRDILSFYLKRAGYQVLVAENGRLALEEMSKVMPDLILSDLRMPQLAGDDLCQIIKGDIKTRDIYFVLVSAMDGTVSRIGGLNLGADDIISKPFHAQEVMAKVDSAFRIIGMQKEIRRKNQELLLYQEGMKSELALAASLQLGLLPSVPCSISGTSFTHRYLPAEGIGGDIYAVSALPEGDVALMIADVSGHGVTAALISAMVKTYFETQIRMGSNPLEWAHAINRDLARNTLNEQFATAFLARMDRMRDEMRFVVAGHVAQILIPGGAGGGLHRPEMLHGKGFMLGIDETMPFEEYSCPLKVGDRLILYTDGLVEVEREDKSLLGDDGLLRLCADLPGDEDAAADYLVEQAREFNTPAPFVDDVTLVIVDRFS
jgi:serine phosphatase RsbU (regulator of sigma subunit)